MLAMLLLLVTLALGSLLSSEGFMLVNTFSARASSKRSVITDIIMSNPISQPWQTKKFEDTVRIICPKVFDISILNDNVDAFFQLHQNNIAEHFNAFNKDKACRITRLDYFHMCDYATTLIPYTYHSNDDPSSEKVIYNIMMSDRCFLFSAPEQVGTVKRVLEETRRQCTGWCLLQNEIFNRMPALMRLGELLLGKGNVIARWFYYNREHETIDIKMRNKHGDNVVVTVERWGVLDPEENTMDFL